MIYRHNHSKINRKVGRGSRVHKFYDTAIALPLNRSKPILGLFFIPSKPAFSMKFSNLSQCFCAVLLGSFQLLMADDPTIRHKIYQAPPGPPPTQGPTEKQKQAPTKQPSATAVGTQYLIGDPSDEEQLVLELINRSRADANAEAQRYLNILQNNLNADIVSSVDFFAQTLITSVAEGERYNTFLTAMVDQFALQPQNQPPLSFNSDLIDAARIHSNDMFQNAFQSHTGTDGRSSSQRMGDEGYPQTGFRGENIFAFSDSAEQGHAGFDIDWGTSGTTGLNENGMQSPPGHRNNIHSSNFTEIGIGVTLGVNTVNNTTVGPFVLTQDMGSRSDITPFITGVAYYDINGNDFYDLGEGLSGITVEVAGNDFFAITTTSGAYSVPVPGDGSYSVTYSGTGFDDVMETVDISGEASEKVDYTPVYNEPVITPPAIVAVGSNNSFQFTTVGGATGYNIRESTLLGGTPTEDAEDNGTNWTIEPADPGYNIVQTFDVPPGGGSRAFHLAHPDFVNQVYTLSRTFFPGASSSLQFQSRLGLATTGEFAIIEVSVDGGSSWEEVFSQAGTNSSSESSFRQATVPLSDFQDKAINIRFFFKTTGSLFTNPPNETGWYFDNITLTDTQELGGVVEGEIGPGSSFTFNPEAVGTFLLQVQAINNDRFFPFGPAIVVQSEISTGSTDVFRGEPIDEFPGWMASAWYKNYNIDIWPWIFHDEHHWQFVDSGSSESVIFLWDLGLEQWIFLNENTYRWIFIFGGDNTGWAFTFNDNRPGRRFFARLDGSLSSVPPDLPVN